MCYLVFIVRILELIFHEHVEDSPCLVFVDTIVLEGRGCRVLLGFLECRSCYLSAEVVPVSVVSIEFRVSYVNVMVVSF
jgi:hypothetical protein